MIGIVITGHGQFARGLGSAVELIAGKQENYEEVTFDQERTPEELSAAIKQAIVNVDAGAGVLVFTDLKGGTPFKESVMLSVEHPNVFVLTGTNIAMLLEASLARLGEPEISGFAKMLAETGKDQVDLFDPASLVKQEEESDEDGI